MTKGVSTGDRPVHAIKAVGILAGRVSFRVPRREAIVSGLLAAMSLLIALGVLFSGRYPISVAEAMNAVIGKGDPMFGVVLIEWRLPRVALAFLLGACLGMSGAIFQSLTRNPLGSPDIIGFSAGSYTGALVVILLFSGGYYETAAGALVGGIATASLVYLLAWRRGVQGFRLIIVGIGVAAMLCAFNAWMIKEAALQVAMSAAIWGAGSLNGLGVEQLIPMMLAAAILVPATLFFSRPLRQMEMGDDVAHASGVDVNRARLILMTLGVALTAIVTAAAGPISFIALVAPQIARRLGKSSGPMLGTSGLMGGLLLLIADWAAQHAFGVQLPVGVMTVSIGGLYFLFLLLREGRK
ncbi:FecCD family ABC transporter permease [Aliirhizobium smilacinae]|uniref:Iron chelate uptake ABC transporter family permease subunit n=1 Tax=Aliirhizobium smilacinae TaxID=1395944 RepID=A0A5C4X800_9HYPH|nr:iron chelate uptake ABC transporter family permease subunit [Rhizobium smilacinae]TNM59522.1 iron chelate uptake ABC transporter family permease subunit [Rhizobium smilacinae]